MWDRRCLVTTGQASGVLVGHLEGITFIDSRGDGRYLISNGKDQAIKLWDIRKMASDLSQYVTFCIFVCLDLKIVASVFLINWINSAWTTPSHWVKMMLWVQQVLLRASVHWSLIGRVWNLSEIWISYSLFFYGWKSAVTPLTNVASWKNSICVNSLKIKDNSRWIELFDFSILTKSFRKLFRISHWDL